MEQLYHRFSFFIYPQDVDCTKFVTINALGGYVLNAAGLAATENGFGMEQLHSEGLAWVVSRISLEMSRFPVQYERIIIETWVEEYGRITTIRNFKIYDINERLIGNACTLWAIIDLKTRRPYNLNNRPEWHRFANGVPALTPKPTRIKEIQSVINTTHRVTYSDVDFNGHTNSMKYVEWMLDTYDLNQFRENTITRIEINYSHEALYNDLVHIYKEEEQDVALFKAQSANGLLFCKMKFFWKKRIILNSYN